MKKKGLFIIGIIIIAEVLLGLCVGSIMNNYSNEFEGRLDNAEIIESETELRKSIEEGKTILAYSELKALDTVSFSEISGEYSYLRKVVKERRMHTRTVPKTTVDGKGNTKTTTVTETYWSWDVIDTEIKHSNTVLFLNVELSYDKIKFPDSEQISVIENEKNKKKTYYYGTESVLKGTVFGNFCDETIFISNKTIPEAKEYLKSQVSLNYWLGLIIIMLIVNATGFAVCMVVIHFKK